MFAVRTKQQANKVQGIFRQLRITQPAHRPVHPGGAEVCAGREGNDDVPRLLKQFAHVTLMMVAGLVSWQKIARPSIVAECRERIAHRSAIFTCCQDFHW